MNKCKFCIERKYSGSLYKYWTDVSVDELIKAGVKVYWHVNLYSAGKYGSREEDLEESKWKLAKSQKEMDDIDLAMVERNGRFYECRVMIYFDIKDDQLWKEIQRLDLVNEEKEHAYWKDYVESGRADRAAIERGWTLMGADPAWYDRQVGVPELA